MLSLTQDCENNKRSNIDNLIKRDIIVNNKWESITFRMVSGEVGRVKDQLDVLMHILSGCERVLRKQEKGSHYGVLKWKSCGQGGWENSVRLGDEQERGGGEIQ